MAGLEDLKVSLTKNGYFKVAEVIKRHASNEVLDNINGVYEGINLERSQIANMLSADDEGILPTFWDEIRLLPEAIDSFTFIAVLFSHNFFIKRFQDAHSSEMRGTLKRNDFDDKTFTNLIYTMQTINLCTYNPGANEIDFNFQPLFKLEIGPLVKKLLATKLNKTGWREPDDEDPFTRNYYEQCYYYGFHRTLGISEIQFRDWLESNIVEMEEPVKYEENVDKVTVSASLLVALAAKPFVILAGATGTGKTATIRQCAMSLSPKGALPEFNHVFIPVEAGWTDARHLLGYRNPFGKDGEMYKPTPLLLLMLRANHPAHKEIPFFVILDEMNLSSVEMYFSRFLSLIETGQHGRAESVVSVDDLRLMLRSGVSGIEAAYIENAINAGGVYLGPNIFIVGTVNVDETTHAFSPKVLDRSFVLQYDVSLPSKTEKVFAISLEDRAVGAANIISKYLIDSHKYEITNENSDFLDLVHAKLGRFAFGPRVTHESHRYSVANKELQQIVSCHEEFVKEESIKDRIMMQKILPKLRGNRSQLGKTVEELLSIASTVNLPLSKAKLVAMKSDLASPGFSNFFA